MAQKPQKASAKGAVPGGVKKDVSFSKRSGATTMSNAGRSLKGEEDYGPRKTGNRGAKVSDGAGTRSMAGLPPQTEAMAAPAAELPSAATEMAADTLPVPDANTDPASLGMVVGWDYMRDQKLGKRGNS